MPDTDSSPEQPEFSGPLIDALGELNGVLAPQGLAVSLAIDKAAARRGEARFVIGATLVPIPPLRAVYVVVE